MKKRPTLQRLAIFVGIGSVLLAIPGTSYASTNPIKNGSFEKPVVTSGGFTDYNTGQTLKHWKVVGASGDVSIVSGAFTSEGISFPAHSGKQWLDLTGYSSNTATGVSQSVATVSGRAYTLTFWVGNVDSPSTRYGTTSTVNVQINGSQVFAATNSSTTATTLSWEKFKVHFTAKSSATTIAFINGDPSNDNSNGLDSVSVS